jgi:CPA2 family monovalent cation:H+ antiporter-2|uniref:Potassium transporter KefB n=1 Tax=Desulfomonile tiedjei TaxID=2358 RepID=A0A7C4ETJ3_9BACT
MSELLLHDIVYICALALGVSLVCHRLAVPPVVGFLITGVICGPHGLQMIYEAAGVEQIAEVGVVCLLFTIGVEFSLKTLVKARFITLFGGGMQVAFTLVGGASLASVLGLTLNHAVFFGFLLALSSTAIVLKILQDTVQIETPHGRLTVAMLIFQDIIVVPMMLLAPFLAGKGENILPEIGLLLVKSLAIVAIVILGTRLVVPLLLHHVAKMKNRELFLIAVVMLGLGVAWFTHAMGLSLALGAFIAGLIVSESEFGETALGNILPFRDLFTSIFFVSVGMLLDLQYVMNRFLFLLFVTAAIMILKFVMASSAALLLKLPLRTAVLAGLAVSQIGEFSFVLSKPGLTLGILTQESYQLFLGVSVITMMITPYVIGSSERIADAMLKLPLPWQWKTGLERSHAVHDKEQMRGHLIIVGYGINGKHLARAASTAGIPRLIIELNPETVQREKAKGESIFQGDAAQDPVLRHAGIQNAAVLVIVISDPEATKRIIATARALNKSIHIICRTRFLSQVESLQSLGADEVIPEDYEASIEILTRVLTRYFVPRRELDDIVDQIRADHYGMLRSLLRHPTEISDVSLQSPNIDVHSLRIAAGSTIAGKTILELNLRREYGVSILGIKRGTSFMANPAAAEKIEVDDILVVLGEPASISLVEKLANPS